MRGFGSIVLALVLLFLLGPFVVIILAGFSAGDTLAFPPEGLSLRWYLAVFGIESFRASFLLSLFLAIGSTLAALVLGIPVAYAVARYAIPGGEAMRTLLTSPIIIPAIIIGLALLRYLVIPLGIGIVPALFLGHTALLIPYAVRVVGASLTISVPTSRKRRSCSAPIACKPSS